MKPGLYYLLLPTIITLVLQACGTSRTVKRLEGTWGLMRANGGERLELWTKVSTGVMTGRGLRVTGTDTILLETLILRKSNGQWQYIADVPDQNEGKPIAFDCTSIKKNEMVFTNGRHDFPQRIGYRLVPVSGETHTDSLVVTLGTLDADHVVLRFTRRP
jgi:hypothetical protein